MQKLGYIIIYIYIIYTHVYIWCVGVCGCGCVQVCVCECKIKKQGSLNASPRQLAQYLPKKIYALSIIHMEEK